MSTLFLPKSTVTKLKSHSQKDKSLLSMVEALSGSPVSFDTIKGYSNDFRNKIVSISHFLDQNNAQDHIDLTDECVALAIDGESVKRVLQSGDFTNLIALLGISNGHITFSLLGADINNPLAISPLYKTEEISGIETWPRRGLLGMTKDFNDVLDCK